MVSQDIVGEGVNFQFHFFISIVNSSFEFKSFISIVNYDFQFWFSISILIFEIENFYFYVLLLFLVINYSLSAERVRSAESECDVGPWRSSDVVPSMRTLITKSYCFWRSIRRSQHWINRLFQNWSRSTDCVRLIYSESVARNAIWCLTGGVRDKQIRKIDFFSTFSGSLTFRKCCVKIWNQSEQNSQNNAPLSDACFIPKRPQLRAYL